MGKKYDVAIIGGRTSNLLQNLNNRTGKSAAVIEHHGED